MNISWSHLAICNWMCKIQSQEQCLRNIQRKSRKEEVKLPQESERMVRASRVRLNRESRVQETKLPREPANSGQAPNYTNRLPWQHLQVLLCLSSRILLQESWIRKKTKLTNVPSQNSSTYNFAFPCSACTPLSNVFLQRNCPFPSS